MPDKYCKNNKVKREERRMKENQQKNKIKNAPQNISEKKNYHDDNMVNKVDKIYTYKMIYLQIGK